MLAPGKHQFTHHLVRHARMAAVAFRPDGCLPQVARAFHQLTHRFQALDAARFAQQLRQCVFA
jgi:hypothetical protein